VNKVFDCFLYNHEEQLLTTRLRLLSHVVDKFVIVFSHLTFAGSKPRQPFPDEIITSLGLWDKIELIELHELRGDTPMAKEEFSRDCIKWGLHSAGPRDLIMVSDVDEIPRPDVVASLSHLADATRRFVLACDYFNFKFNYQLVHGLHAVWAGPVVCSMSDFESGQRLRDQRWGLLDEPSACVDDAGWHFSFLTSCDDVLTKLDNYGHREDYVQSRGNVPVASLIADRKGFFDNRHPGSVWAVIDLASFRCGALEQLVAQFPTLLVHERPDDPTVITRQIRHSSRRIWKLERDKVLWQMGWRELAQNFVSRASRKIVRRLK
jgi:beta-1,4-mannosyl-glycoprotein beta-1,4-N-acetylglucosaminyltransferase